MTKFPIKLLLLIFIIVFTLLITQAYAAVDNGLQNSSAKTIVKLGIMQGYPDGTLKLQNNIKRSEFAALVVRMFDYDKETDPPDSLMTFKDIKKTHWAYNYMKIAIKHKIIGGYPDNTVGPDRNVTNAEAQTMLVRALGYESTLIGAWPDNVMNKASQLGISKNVDLANNKQLTRGEISVLLYNSLTIDFKTN